MYKKNPNVVLREIDPSYFLIDITKCYNNTEEKMFITDEMGAEIWADITDGGSFETVFTAFLEKLTDEKTDDFKMRVRTDLKEYIQHLKEQGYLYEV